jgi:pyruvate formate lyase activating enzyme
MTEPAPTSVRQLIRAAEIGVEEGLHFVYAGNVPGRVAQWESTFCPGCDELLIERTGYLVRDYKITRDGKCPHCQRTIPGVWPVGGATEVSTGNSTADFYERRPRRVNPS